MLPEEISPEVDGEHADAPEQHEAFKMIVGPRVMKLLRENPFLAQHDPQCQCYCSFEMFLLSYPCRVQRIAYLWQLIRRKDYESEIDAMIASARMIEGELMTNFRSSRPQSA